MLGFAVVLAISAASMGFAYLGFENVSDGVDSYRRSVQEADLSRDIDRELISYRSLARYFVVTGKEEDGIKFSDYFHASEAVRRLPSHRILALLRGRKEGFLRLAVVLPDDATAGGPTLPERRLPKPSANDTSRSIYRRHPPRLPRPPGAGAPILE